MEATRCSILSDFAFGVSPVQIRKTPPRAIVWLDESGLQECSALAFAHASLAFSAFATCTAPKNAIEAENCLPGNPPSQWVRSGAGSPNIQGFATDISVNGANRLLQNLHECGLVAYYILSFGILSGNGADS